MIRAELGCCRKIFAHDDFMCACSARVLFTLRPTHRSNHPCAHVSGEGTTQMSNAAGCTGDEDRLAEE